MRVTSLTLETIAESAAGAVEFTFAPRRPIRFRAGQAGLIITARGGAKPFTFASGDRSGRISIATTLHSGSRFKRALAGLAPGGRVLAAGAIGTLPAVDPSQSQVFVAQGIGITPFLSMARSHGSLNATLRSTTITARACGTHCAGRSPPARTPGGRCRGGRTSSPPSPDS